MHRNKHEFALLCPNLSELVANKRQDITITDDLLVHRITHVLRLAPQESIILFDRAHHAFCTLQTITKKNCTVRVNELHTNTTILPIITFLLPLLKRDALEELVYSLTEIGVTSIQLIKTEKIQRSWNGTPEYERLQKIIIAAAEQSKNYTYPLLHEPCALDEALRNCPNPATKLYADPEGELLAKFFAETSGTKQSSFVLMIGPEGDLVQSEKEQLRTAYFTFCALTPTILRSVQAGAVFAGIIRSFYR